MVILNEYDMMEDGAPAELCANAGPRERDLGVSGSVYIIVSGKHVGSGRLRVVE